MMCILCIHIISPPIIPNKELIETNNFRSIPLVGYVVSFKGDVESTVGESADTCHTQLLLAAGRLAKGISRRNKQGRYAATDFQLWLPCGKLEAKGEVLPESDVKQVQEATMTYDVECVAAI